MRGLHLSFVWLVNKTLVLTLCVGITFGFSFAYMVLTLAQYGPQDSFYTRLLGSRGREWLGPDPVAMFGPRVDDVLQSDTFTTALSRHSVDTVPEEHGADDPAHIGGDDEAVQLSSRVRVLCWVMTQPANHEKKARHVKATWGRRCNKLVFMSSKADTELPTVALDVQEGRNFLWAKTKEAFRYVYEHHRDDADWFFKADDDTYAVMENMRFMLEPYSPNDPIYFGCKFKPFTKQGYMSGGAGYVLSREALRRFVTVGLNDPTKCKKDHGGAEDAEMGKCLERLNVTAGDSRDSLGRYRFFPFTPESHLVAEKFPKNFWYWKYIFYPQLKGMDCCSDSAISFHYVPPNMMYTIEYLVYHLKPYGVRTRLVPGAPPDSAVIPAGAHFPVLEEKKEAVTTGAPPGGRTTLAAPAAATRAALTTREVAKKTPSPRPATTRGPTAPTRVRRSVAASTRGRRSVAAASTREVPRKSSPRPVRVTRPATTATRRVRRAASGAGSASYLGRVTRSSVGPRSGPVSGPSAGRPRTARVPRPPTQSDGPATAPPAAPPVPDAGPTPSKAGRPDAVLTPSKASQAADGSQTDVTRRQSRRA